MASDFERQLNERLDALKNKAPYADPADAATPLSETELDELERRLARADDPVPEHTRAWALVAIRQLRSQPKP